jgi:Tfp pilus assembly protein PilF
MLRRLVLLLPMFAAALAPARDKAETWTEVRSPHFTIVTNSSEKQGRRVADQLERVRLVFHVAFPKLQIDYGSPIVVLAIKDEKDFKALEPEAYLAKGSLKVAGLFLPTPERNFSLMRLDAEGSHPYAVVYHEYTHFLLSKSAEWMPLWMNEGLAQFYQNSNIRDNDVLLGEPSSESIYLLRQNALLPLATLLTVDARSEYYHEENRGSIFYAESWALTHYLFFKDHQDQKRRLSQYSDLLIQRVDPVTAATRAFGDLNELQAALEAYIRQGRFEYFKMTAATQVDDSAFKVQVLSQVQSDTIRADFLAYNDRSADARLLLDEVLKEDPDNVSAHETLAFVEYRQGHLEEARKRYAHAVQLDSQSFFAHYSFALISMDESREAQNDSQIESSLRTAIRLNPAFAPAYDRLAVFLGMRNRDLEEARMLGLSAISLEPANVGYRANVGHILMEMGKNQSAVQALTLAAKLAKTPQEVEEIQHLVKTAQAYVDEERLSGESTVARNEGRQERGADQKLVPNSDVPHLSHRKEFAPSGPHRFVAGILNGIHCDGSRLELTVTSGAATISLHSDNYYKVEFSALNFQTSADLKPCSDLENRPAKVEYVESANKSDSPHLIAIELHK